MKSSRSIPALGAFFVAIALAVAACGSGIPGNSVAVVAGNPISTQAFNHWMYVFAKAQAAQVPGQPVIAPNDPPNFAHCIAQARAELPSLAKASDKTIRAACARVFTALSNEVMSYLIPSYWYQAEAHKLGIKVTNAQVQKTLNEAKKAQFSTAAQFNTFLNSNGLTMADVLYRIRVEDLYAKLLAKQPTKVTPAAIAAYYNSHKSEFGTPETRNLRIVLAKDAADAAAAKKALQSGHSWAAVAKKYSIDPTTKNTGGLLMGVSKNGQDAALTTAAFAAPTNQLIGPVKGQFGEYVIDVLKVTPATQRSLDAQTSALIKQTLTTQLQTTAANAVANRAKKDWLSQTKCRAQYAVPYCSGYKAPTSVSATTAAP
jgi:parvulin-like peptidyl-prolyl isomerase